VRWLGGSFAFFCLALALAHGAWLCVWLLSWAIHIFTLFYIQHSALLPCSTFLLLLLWLLTHSLTWATTNLGVRKVDGFVYLSYKFYLQLADKTHQIVENNHLLPLFPRLLILFLRSFIL